MKQIDWEECYQKCLDGSMKPEDIDCPLDEVLRNLAHVAKLPYIELQAENIDTSMLRSFSIFNATKFATLPLKSDDGKIHFASLNPFNPLMRHTLQNLFGAKESVFYFASPQSFAFVLEWVSVEAKALLLQSALLEEHKAPSQDSTTLQSFVALLLEEALRLCASDVHIESRDYTSIRMRIDGCLIERFCFDLALFAPLSSQLKLISKLDISEKRKGQDGRFQLPTFPKVDFRISTIPIAGGESIVLRILDNSRQNLTLHQLGFAPDSIDILRQTIQKTHGILFVTGPTGSGKSTTLYALLQLCNKERQKIITIEDPIEYEMPKITQVVLNDKINFGFSEVLRNILRQDPDILMIGEVRDQETLQLALQASLTGHLVLCTLHTNDALESITRLLDMGIEPYFLASALLLVVSQRLVPKLCPHCRESYPIDYADSRTTFYRSKGCVRCYGRGFLGRELLYEILPITKNLKEALHQKATQKELLEIAKNAGFVRMVEQGLEKAKSGLMTLEILHGIQNDF